MKQHITVEQLSSLTDLKVLKLVNKIGNSYNKVTRWNNDENLIDCLKLSRNDSIYISAYEICSSITIGKMIEIINNKCYSWELYMQAKYSDTLVIKIKKEDRKIGFRGCECDALFEAVKGVLW